MRKRFMVLLMAICCLIGCGENGEGRLSPDDVYVCVYTYDNESEKVTESYSYNESGFLRNQTCYSNDGKITYVLEMDYDKEGNMINLIETNYENGNEEIVTTNYERKYDEFGNQIVEEKYVNEEARYRYVYTYDDNGNITNEYHYKSDGSGDGYYSYIYNESNNLIEDILYNSDGSVSWRKTYEYDENNNLIKKYCFAVNPVYPKNSEAEDWWETYEYDEAGNLIQITETYRSGKSTTEKYEYDENNNLIRYMNLGYGGDVLDDISYKYVSLADYLKNKEKYEIDIVNSFSSPDINMAIESKLESPTAEREEIKKQAKEFYGSFLEYYRKYEANGFQGLAEMINSIYSKWGFDKELYYTVVDLADDGVPELFISDGSTIYDAYAISEYDGQVWYLVKTLGADLGDRVRCDICENNVLKVSSSGGAESGMVEYYKLNQQETTLTLIEGIYNEDGYCYYGTIAYSTGSIYDGTYKYGYTDAKSVTTDFYLELEEKYPEKTDIQWLKLSQFYLE